MNPEDSAAWDEAFEQERWEVLGRGYNYMTDEEVAADLRRREAEWRDACADHARRANDDADEF
ncbi:hypothetical protein [Actinoplanes rectilineatus]|uniref:hypothetical protein n=1 Tax=Actinoplanes rectilineatus TaxID=113571 RepID=UPI0005F28285|nr:hypothetical protein [Actinoplanes rectilineatus]